MGRYELVGVLGRGGVGTVHKARGEQGLVALKLLNAVDSERLVRFGREKRLMEALGEVEGFVPVLDTGESEVGPFVVMPLVEGGTLRERLERGPLGIDASLQLAVQLATALGRAHALGIVHRDLKPENVLFTAEGTPLVADLGLAKHFDRQAKGASQSIQLSTAGSIRGTFGYMAPEQMRSADSVGPAADVFALGAIAYECLAGRPAFVADTLGDLYRRAEEGAFEPLLRAAPEVPRAVARAVESALDPDVSGRPENGSALAERLREAALPAPVWRKAVLVALLPLAALVYFAHAALTPPTEALPPVVAPPPPPPPPRRPVRHTSEATDLARRAVEAAVDFPPRNDEALELAQRATDLDPELAQAWSTLAFALRHKGRDEEAEAAVNKALALEPGSVNGLRERAKLRFKRRDWRGTVEDMNRILVVRDDDATDWCRRAVARRELGDLAGSLEDSDRAVSIAPSSQECVLTRGVTRARLLDLRAAFTDLDRAVQIADTANARRERGFIRVTLGDRGGAIEDLRRSLELAPTAREADLVRAKLDELEGAH